MQIQKILSWVLLIGIITSGVFQISSSTTNAQQATTQPTVTCAPSKKEILRDEKVTFVATVKNSSSSITYSWKGTNIQSVNADRVTVSYGSLGVKKATTTVVTNGFSIEAGCSVEVKANVQLQTGQQNNLQQQAQQQLQNILGGQQGGQQGGQTGQQGGQSTSNGGNSGGSQQQTGGSQPSNNTNGSQITQNQQGGGGSNPANSQNQTQQELADCEKPSESADDVKSMVQEQTQEAKKATQQQMVPVNPIPVVEPILNIQENIKLLTAKEIGTADGTSAVALDKKAACKIDVMLKKSLDKAVNFIYKGDNGEGLWVLNYPKQFGEQSDNSKAAFVRQLQNNSNSCTPEEDKNIARALLVSQSSVFIKESESCPIQKEDKYDLTVLENFLDQADPQKSLSFRLIQSTEELNRTRSTQLVANAYEIQVNEGFKSKLDKDKNIELSPKVYVPQSMDYMTAALKRFIELEETGEGESEAWQKYVEKVIQSPDDGPSSIDQDIT